MRLLVPTVGLAAAGQLALAGTASASHAAVSGARGAASSGIIKANWNVPSDLDCNGWALKPGATNIHSDKSYADPAAPGLRAKCVDPAHFVPTSKGVLSRRFTDNGWYIGHDEPSVKFISSRAGSGNTMTYGMQLPVDPSAAPTANSSVTKYGELSVAPWFGLPICDPRSYPQNKCTPDSDHNSGLISNPNAAGSAFMELQFYPPGFAPFVDATSCSAKQWCAALTIDSLECTFGFSSCNNSCIEPVNFSYLQTNGIPPGPPAPQDPSLKTFTGNSHTLKMNPRDVLKVSISDPKSGLLAKVIDLTTHKTGYIQASAKNGFADTKIGSCNGVKHTFHAEYSTAKQGNQVPWAALEGGVLMEQEIGHFESCDSVSSRLGSAAKFPHHGGSFSDPKVYQTCNGGVEGTNATGEGPCNLSNFVCSNSTTQGATGPQACPVNGPLAQNAPPCEFSDANCMPKGARTVTFNKTKVKETWPVAGCMDNAFQNGDLDFDGTDYQADWPNGSSNFPTPFRYIGPFTHGHAYPSIQFETDVAGSEYLCQTDGTNCTAPPIGAAFYPFWSLNNVQKLKGLKTANGMCVWNFGNDITGVTKTDFGGDSQYGTPDVARFFGTVISPVQGNPTLANGCTQITLK